MMNFVSLVNRAIVESKQTIDPLSAGDFANPTRTVLYDRLKTWVAQAYQDMLEERKEWFFTTERGVVTIQPRLHLARIDSSYVPQVGDILTGDQSEVRFEITEIFYDNEGQDVTDEATISVAYDTEVNKDELIQWETVSAISGENDYESIARIENRGLYKMSQYIPTVGNVDLNSLTIKRSVFDPDFTDDRSTEMVPLRSLSWPQYMRHYDNFYTPLGDPLYVAEASNGDTQFFPFPDGLFDITFDYEQTAEPLVEWDDAPYLIPEKHQLILVWKALMDLADFNNDRALYSRANKRYLERLGWMMRDYLPEMTLDTNLFYRR